MHIKRDNIQKRRGHAQQQIKTKLDEESSTNKALTERIANWRHALHFTERYEHATSETNRKELNRTSRLISKLCSLFHRSNGVLAYLIHLQSHLNETKLYILFFLIYSIHHSKDKIKTFKTPPVHLLHTIGSQKYFGHFCVSTNSSISL